MEFKNIILDRIKTNKGYISTKELNELKINRYYLSMLVKEGVIERVKNGLYRDTLFVPENELVEVGKMISKGVFCLESAAEYYGLTTTITSQYKIAIPQKSKVIIPVYPPIKLIYFADKTYSLGIIEINIEGNEVKIYDLEKTVCDIARYRKRIENNIYSEVLREYVKRKDKNIGKLLDYAKITGVYKILKSDLEVLL